MTHPHPQAVENLIEAARARLSKGHNDTCQFVVIESGKYPCSCGHADLICALAALEAEEREPVKVQAASADAWEVSEEAVMAACRERHGEKWDVVTSFDGVCHELTEMRAAIEAAVKVMRERGGKS